MVSQWESKSANETNEAISTAASLPDDAHDAPKEYNSLFNSFPKNQYFFTFHNISLVVELNEASTVGLLPGEKVKLKPPDTPVLEKPNETFIFVALFAE